ncbi:Coiled-coil domain-containing protein 84 [Chamberlinius hualienensis]
MASKVANSQYKYCVVCRHNYEVKMENHVYTKRHKDTVTVLTEKYSAKINEAKIGMANPEIKMQNFEHDVKVWCCFCNCEVPKHASVKSRTVCHLGLLSHLKSGSHLKKTQRFFWVNRVNKELLDQFVLKPEEYDRAIADAVDKVKEVCSKEFLDHQTEVTRITESEIFRKQVLLTPFAATETRTPSSGNAAKYSRDDEELRYQPSEDPISSTAIGPDISVYQQHLRQVRKSKLLRNEVGSNRLQSTNNTKPTESKKEFRSTKQNNVNFGKSRSTYKRPYKPYNSKKYTLE